MGKGLTGIAAFALAVCILGGGAVSDAATFKAPYLVEQAQGKAPNVTAYITGARINGDVTLSGTIDGRVELSQKEKTTVFRKSGEGIHYILLVDNSGSVENRQFAEVKRQIAAMRRTMGENDRMTLYTVGTNSASGEKKNVLGKTARGNKKSEIRRDVKKIKGIPYRGDARSRTVLYRSLNQVLAANQSPQMRTVVLMVTDGEDDSAGKDNSKSSIVKKVKNATIPVYGILLRNKSGKPDKEKIRCTTSRILAEENCRGYYEDCSGNASVKKVKSAFARIKKIVKTGTYVVKMQAASNKKIDGIVRLALTVQSGRSTKTLGTIGMDYSAWEADTEPPVVTDIHKEAENTISFRLTDNSGGVTGADQSANYILRRKTETGAGRVWTVSDVKYDSVNNTVVLVLKDDLYTGDYILTCSNICDDTQEQNPVTEPVEFFLEGLNEQTEKGKQMPRWYWWIALTGIVLLAGIMIIIIIKKKPDRIVEVEHSPPVKPDMKSICLTITDRAGTIRDVDWNVEGSLFVGRSDICNIFFDDERLSKQHFVIEVTKMACYIQDLESTNGTFVNGVKMMNRRMLLDGDVITAGREKFVFHTVQRMEG